MNGIASVDIVARRWRQHRKRVTIDVDVSKAAVGSTQ